MRQVIDLRPVYHRKEERIRAHVILCWLALKIGPPPRIYQLTPATEPAKTSPAGDADDDGLAGGKTGFAEGTNSLPCC